MLNIFYGCHFLKLNLEKKKKRRIHGFEEISKNAFYNPIVDFLCYQVLWIRDLFIHDKGIQ